MRLYTCTLIYAQTLTTGHKLFKEEKENKHIERKIHCIVFKNRKQMQRGLRKEKQKKEEKEMREKCKVK
jgi:hypothetical protein